MLITFITDRAVVGEGWSATYTCSDWLGMEEIPKLKISEKKISRQENLNVNKLVAYPNPVSGILTIESSIKEKATYTIDLINVSGQVILNQRIEAINGKFDIDMSDVTPGPYLLKIITNKSVEIIRVIKN